MARSYTFKQLMTVTGLFVIASVLGVKLLGFRLDAHETRETVYAEPMDMDILSPVQLDVDVDDSIFESTKASVHVCSAAAASLFFAWHMQAHFKHVNRCLHPPNKKN